MLRSRLAYEACVHPCHARGLGSLGYRSARGNTPVCFLQHTKLQAQACMPSGPNPGCAADEDQTQGGQDQAAGHSSGPRQAEVKPARCARCGNVAGAQQHATWQGSMPCFRHGRPACARQKHNINTGGSPLHGDAVWVMHACTKCPAQGQECLLLRAPCCGWGSCQRRPTTPLRANSQFMQEDAQNDLRMLLQQQLTQPSTPCAAGHTRRGAPARAAVRNDSSAAVTAPDEILPTGCHGRHKATTQTDEIRGGPKDHGRRNRQGTGTTGRQNRWPREAAVWCVGAQPPGCSSVRSMSLPAATAFVS